MEFVTRVLNKLEEGDKFVQELEAILPRSKKEYLQDLTTRRACEKTVELAIETVIDVISMIVSQKKLGLPKSEENLIEILEENKILTEDLIKKLKEMKGFRNLLVHKYGDVDDKLVYQYLTEEMTDFTLFSKEIKRYLKRIK